MKKIKWQNNFNTGHPSVDFEHKEMIEIINNALGKINKSHDPKVISGLLGDIHTGISSHFALEEELMRKVGYSDYQVHKDDHEHLLDDIREIMDSFEDSKEAGFEAALVERLINWFGDHFRTLDSKLHSVLG